MDTRILAYRLLVSTTAAALSMTLLLPACTSITPTPPPPTATSTLLPPPPPAPTDTPAPSPSPIPDETQPLPPEPQVVDFAAEDGQMLRGLYYPAAINPSPIVVLMHWVHGGQLDWAAIAPWLQNRGMPVAHGLDAAGGDAAWWDPSWFPPMPEGKSYAVFMFNFRNCDALTGCSRWDSRGWLLDAKAAVETARHLPGVDPNQVVTVGASIGADAAVDACGEGCVAALSLSPGGYLGVNYADAVRAVTEKGGVVQCIFNERDRQTANACMAYTGGGYTANGFEGDAHGMTLIDPGLPPEAQPLQMLLNFLGDVLG